VVDSYSFGQVVVDGTPYDRDLILFPDRVQADWWRREGHRLLVEDLGSVLEYAPEVLVVGTGSSGVMEVPAPTAASVRSRGIVLEVERTAEACRRFNELLGEGKRVVAALHLTC
jgi:hypothetical protein